jgi:hypothetical protein
MLLRWLQHKKNQWTYGMVTNEYSFRKGYRVACISYLGFFGINNGMEFMFVKFLNILKSFDKCHVFINTYKFFFITIITSHLYMFTCLECEHCINTLLKVSSQIRVWNILHYCTKRIFKTLSSMWNICIGVPK